MNWIIIVMLLWGITGICTLIIGDISRFSYALVWLTLMLFLAMN